MAVCDNGRYYMDEVGNLFKFTPKSMRFEKVPMEKWAIPQSNRMKENHGFFEEWRNG